MKRPRPHQFLNVAIVGSLFALLVACVAWGVSFHHSYDWLFSRTTAFKISGGRIWIMRFDRPLVYIPDDDDLTTFRSGAQNPFRVGGFEHFYAASSYEPGKTVTVIPFWFVCETPAYSAEYRSVRELPRA